MIAIRPSKDYAQLTRLLEFGYHELLATGNGYIYIYNQEGEGLIVFCPYVPLFKQVGQKLLNEHKQHFWTGYYSIIFFSFFFYSATYF